MSAVDPQRHPLEALAEDFMERQRRGENPSVSEYVAKHPDLADEIRELFPTIASMERLKSMQERTHGGRVSLGGVKLERLGDYRILREIGRGGMGIVFEAEQESLHRRVAIKVLPRQSLLDPRQLERFDREARLAAALHHTNIVQIYGAGENDGFHYYVMQLIQGPGLDALIGRLARTSPAALPGGANGTAVDFDALCLKLFGAATGDIRSDDDPAYWRGVALIGRQVADALAYAHAQGTLHRDIKPGNLLVDEQGAVQVTDFGLAKALQSSQDLTQSGGITGTLRYMAPEQFEGKTDARSDIYSLGLTLYELLTLQPAFRESDRSALMRRIIEGEAPRPRNLNPHVPRDLETIVLTATARDPGHRYASAAAMAEDLQRFIEDRPLLARRTSSLERAWRWCRRNPAVASLTGVAVLLVVLLAVVSSAGYVRTTRALQGEARQRREAEASVELATATLDRVFDRLAPSRAIALPDLGIGGDESNVINLTAPPPLSRETAALLEDLLIFYGKLAAQTDDTTLLRLKTADASRRVGDIRCQLGQYKEAEAAYRRAIAIYETMAKHSPEDLSLGIEIARIQNDLGGLCRISGRFAEERSAHLTALDLLKSSESNASAAPEARFELARTYYFLGTRPSPAPGAEPQSPAGRLRPSEPLPPLQEGQGRPREYRGPPLPVPPDGPLSEPLPPSGQAELEGPGDSDAQQKQYLRSAIEILQDLTTRYPDAPNYPHMLALCYRDWQTTFGARNPSKTMENMDHAITLLEGLVQNYPDISEYRFDLCEAYAAVDIRHVTSEGFADAEKRLRKALGVSDTLVTRYPNIPSYWASRAHIEHQISTLLLNMQRLAEAQTCARDALQIQTTLIAQFPDVPYYQVWEGMFRLTLANILATQSKPSEAHDMFEENAKALAILLEKHPEMVFLHGLLDQNYRHYASVLRSLGLHDEAAEAIRTADEHRRAYRASDRR